MRRRFAYYFVAMIVVSLVPGSGSAIVTDEAVTPASVKEKDSRFSVEAAREKSGLIQFSITYRLPRPQYLVARFELRDGETVLARTDTPAFVREDAATYHVAVSAKHLAGAKFELSENGFTESGGKPVALPGGTMFRIDLAAFAPPAKEAPATKGD